MSTNVAFRTQLRNIRPNLRLTRANVSLSYVTIAFNVARPFCLMDVAEF